MACEKDTILSVFPDPWNAILSIECDPAPRTMFAVPIECDPVPRTIFALREPSNNVSVKAATKQKHKGGFASYWGMDPVHAFMRIAADEQDNE